MSIKKTYNFYLFDADNTLFDFNKAEEHALSASFESYGLAYSPGVLQAYRDINAVLWPALERGEITLAFLKTERYRRLFDQFGIGEDPSIFNKTYLYNLGQGCFPNAGAVALCKALYNAGKKIYIATNGIRSVQNQRVKGSEIAPYISDIFISEQLGYNKPSPQFFNMAFVKVPDLKRSETLMIGDSLGADIQGGINAGIDTAWYNPQGLPNTHNITPTYEIKSLREVFS